MAAAADYPPFAIRESEDDGGTPFTLAGELDLATTPLTHAQERFASRNRASPGLRSLADQRMVFFYHEGTMLTRRWLVDQGGNVVELDSFARTPMTQRAGLAAPLGLCGG